MEANECKGKCQPVSFLRQKKRQTRRTYSYGYYGDKYNGCFREPIHIIHEVRREIAQPPCETGARSREAGLCLAVGNPWPTLPDSPA